MADMSKSSTDLKEAPNGVEVVETVTVPEPGSAPSDESDALTPEEDRRVRRKIDRLIMSLMFVTYCLQFLDKSTLSYASVFDLISATHLVGLQYSWLGSIVYVAQLICQPLIAYALVKIPLGKFLGVMVFLWGATLSAMVAATGFKGLIAARFFLGAFESSIAPTFIAAVQMWYKRSEQTNRNAIWYSTVGIINMFGSLLAYGLAHIQSDVLHQYQIIFLFCGAITVVFSTVVFIFMPDTISQARFLSPTEKSIAHHRIRTNLQGANHTRTFRTSHLREAALDPKTYIWFALLFSVSIPSGGVTAFGPLIVKGFGYPQFTAILFYLPFGFIQFVAVLTSAALATRLRARGAVLAAFCVPSIVGCAILLTVDHVTGSKAALLVGYYMIAVYPAITPLIYSWSAANTAGDTKRKVVTAVLFVGQSAGNIVGPTLYSTDEAPGYTRGLVSNLVLFVVLVVLAAGTLVYLRLLNRRQERAREALGKVARVGNGMKEEGGAVSMEHADEDRTDRENEDFVYVY